MVVCFSGSQCHINLYLEFSLRQTRFSFTNPYWFPIFHFTGRIGHTFGLICPSIYPWKTKKLFLFSGATCHPKCRGWDQIRRVNGDQWSFNGKLVTSCPRVYLRFNIYWILLTLYCAYIFSFFKGCWWLIYMMCIWPNENIYTGNQK